MHCINKSILSLCLVIDVHFIAEVHAQNHIGLAFEIITITTPTMCSFTFTLLVMTVICSNAPASGDVKRQTPQQTQRSSDEDARLFRRLAQEAPITIPARLSTLLSIRRKGICQDLLHQIAQWTATPDHLLEAGDTMIPISTSCPINNLIIKVAFPVQGVGWFGEPISFEPHQALLNEFKRRIAGGTGVLRVELAHAAIKLEIIKDGDEDDLDSFERDVVAELKRVKKQDLACDVAEITRSSYHMVSVESVIECKLHLTPHLCGPYTGVTGQVILVMKLLKDPVGHPFKQSKVEYLA